MGRKRVPYSMLEKLSTASMPLFVSSPQEIMAIEGLAAAGYVQTRAPERGAPPGLEVTELTKIGAQVASNFALTLKQPVEEAFRKLVVLKFLAVSAGSLALTTLVTRY